MENTRDKSNYRGKANPYPKFHEFVKRLWHMEQDGTSYKWSDIKEGLRAQITKRDLLPMVKAKRKEPTYAESMVMYDLCVSMADQRHEDRWQCMEQAPADDHQETQTIMGFGTDRGSILLQISHKLSLINDPAIREISDMVAQLASL